MKQIIADLTVYTAPVLSLLSAPGFVEPPHMPVNWNGDAHAGEMLSEFAGRLCYMSQNNPAQKTTKQYIEHILEVGHGSVLEHANYSILSEGVSRSLTHELVRHRAGMAYSQLSQRFVDSSSAAFVIPPAVPERGGSAQLMTYDVWETQCRAALQAYEFLTERLMGQFKHITDKTLRRKRAREAARAVLPNSTETKIIATGNVRAWRHILVMRGSIHADMEIQRWALAVHKLLAEVAPCFFGDFYIDDEGSLTTPYLKV